MLQFSVVDISARVYARSVMVEHDGVLVKRQQVQYLRLQHANRIARLGLIDILNHRPDRHTFSEPAQEASAYGPLRAV